MELSPVNHLLWLRTCAPFDLRNVPFLWMQQKCWRIFSVCLLHVSTGSIHSETHGTHLCGASSFLLLLVQTFLHCFVCWFSIFMFPFEITFCASRSPLDIGTNSAAWRRIRKEPQHNIGLIQRFLFVSFSGCLIPHFCFSFFCQQSFHLPLLLLLWNNVSKRMQHFTLLNLFVSLSVIELP